jgi:hypothetical protein
MATASKMEIEAEVDTFGRIFKAWKRQQILFQVVVIILPQVNDAGSEIHLSPTDLASPLPTQVELE